jgi:hypothetical protein
VKFDVGPEQLMLFTVNIGVIVKLLVPSLGKVPMLFPIKEGIEFVPLNVGQTEAFEFVQL